MRLSVPPVILFISTMETVARFSRLRVTDTPEDDDRCHVGANASNTSPVGIPTNQLTESNSVPILPPYPSRSGTTEDNQRSLSQHPFSPFADDPNCHSNHHQYSFSSHQSSTAFASSTGKEDSKFDDTCVSEMFTLPQYSLPVDSISSSLSPSLVSCQESAGFFQTLGKQFGRFSLVENADVIRCTLTNYPCGSVSYPLSSKNDVVGASNNDQHGIGNASSNSALLNNQGYITNQLPSLSNYSHRGENTSSSSNSDLCGQKSYQLPKVTICQDVLHGGKTSNLISSLSQPTQQQDFKAALSIDANKFCSSDETDAPQYLGTFSRDVPPPPRYHEAVASLRKTPRAGTYNDSEEITNPMNLHNRSFLSSGHLPSYNDYMSVRSQGAVSRQVSPASSSTVLHAKEEPIAPPVMQHSEISDVKISNSNNMHFSSASQRRLRYQRTMKLPRQSHSLDLPETSRHQPVSLLPLYHCSSNSIQVPKLRNMRPKSPSLDCILTAAALSQSYLKPINSAMRSQSGLSGRPSPSAQGSNSNVIDDELSIDLSVKVNDRDTQSQYQDPFMRSKKKHLRSRSPSKSSAEMTPFPPDVSSRKSFDHEEEYHSLSSYDHFPISSPLSEPRLTTRSLSLSQFDKKLTPNPLTVPAISVNQTPVIPEYESCALDPPTFNQERRPSAQSLPDLSGPTLDALCPEILGHGGKDVGHGLESPTFKNTHGIYHSFDYLDSDDYKNRYEKHHDPRYKICPNHQETQVHQQQSYSHFLSYPQVNLSACIDQCPKLMQREENQQEYSEKNRNQVGPVLGSQIPNAKELQAQTRDVNKEQVWHQNVLKDQERQYLEPLEEKQALKTSVPEEHPMNHGRETKQTMDQSQLARVSAPPSSSAHLCLDPSCSAPGPAYFEGSLCLSTKTTCSSNDKMHLESCQSGGGYSPDFGTSLYGMETDFTITDMSENIKSFISSRQPSPELDISSINNSLGQTYVKETTPDRDLGVFPDLFFREGSPVQEVIGGLQGILVSTFKGEPMLSEASPMPFSPPAISVDVAEEDYQCDSSIMSSSNAITEALGDLNANFGFTDDEWHTSLDSLLTIIPETTPLPELVVTNQREEEIAFNKAKSQTSVGVEASLPQDRLLGLPGTNSYDSCMETPVSGPEPPLPFTSSPMSVSPGGSSIPSPMTSLRSSFNHGRRYKRPHSISPSNNDNLDLNTIIRLSPNCLMSSPPNIAQTFNANSLSGSPGGSYGHYLPRPETNNNNIQRTNLNFTSLLSDEDMKVNSSSVSTSMVTSTSHSDPMLFKMEASEISHDVVDSSTPYTSSPYLNSLVSPIIHRTRENQVTSSCCSLIQSPLCVTQVTCLASSNDASFQISSNSCSYSIVSSTTRDQHPSTQSSSSSFPFNFNYPTSEDTTLKSPVSETQRGHLTQTHHHRTPSVEGTTPHYPDEDHSPYLEDDVSGDGEISDESSEPRVCRWVDCNAVFQDKASLSRHIERAHVDQRKGDDYTCFWSACQRKYRAFNARYKLLIHMRVHSGEKPNKCSFSGCDKAFSRLENLKIHLRSHTGERPYVCVHSHCSKAFSNSSDRAKHQRTHLDAKPYVCCVPGCQKRYTDPSSLRKHIKNHNARDQLLAKRKLQCRSSEGASRGPLMAPLPPLLSMHSSERRGRIGVGGSPGGDCGGAEPGDVVRFSLRCHVLSRRPREVMHDSLGLPELTLATQEDLDLWIS